MEEVRCLSSVVRMGSSIKNVHMEGVGQKMRNKRGLHELSARNQSKMQMLRGGVNNSIFADIIY